MAIALVAVSSIAFDTALIGGCAWLTIFLGNSMWWWLPVGLLSMSQTMTAYKFVNAVNGAHLKLVGE